MLILRLALLLVAFDLLGASYSQAADELAHLHVYRSRRYVGAALAPSIYVDDAQIARVGNGRRVTIKLSPGPHTIRSDDKSSRIALDAKAGEDYYVRIDEAMGFWKGHGKLTLLAAEQGAAEYKLEAPVEDDRRISKEVIEDERITPTLNPSDAESSEQATASIKPAAFQESASDTATGSISIAPNPTAEIYVDGEFIGNSPATLKLSPGKHSVKIVAAGYRDWARDITVLANSELNLTPTLEKQ